MASAFDHLALGARVSIALAVSIVIAVAAYRLRALDGGGSLAAIFVGTAVLGLGGAAGGAALFAFFISGSALSRLPTTGGAVHFATETYGAKGGRRDAAQVLANGGVAAGCAAASGLLATLHSPLSGVWLAAAIGALAAAAGDTWAAEIGVRLGRAPRMILGLTPVIAGRSGAVTAAGTLASFAGGALVGLAAAATGATHPAFAIVSSTLAGFVGSTIDSMLGAGAQSLWRCAVCERFGELPVHHDAPATLVRGVPWVTNDMVNLTATLATATLTFLAAL